MGGARKGKGRKGEGLSNGFYMKNFIVSFSHTESKRIKEKANLIQTIFLHNRLVKR